MNYNDILVSHKLYSPVLKLRRATTTSRPEADELRRGLAALARDVGFLAKDDLEKLGNTDPLAAKFVAAAAAFAPLPNDKKQWTNRIHRAGRNPATFIREEFLEELAAALPIERRDVARLQPVLGKAYTAHIKQYPDDSIWETDRKKGWTSTKDMSAEDALSHIRGVQRRNYRY